MLRNVKMVLSIQIFESLLIILDKTASLLGVIAR